MNVTLTYYSRTGNTRAVARALCDGLERPEISEIRPVERRRYLDWLARSFVPGSRVDIRDLDTDLTAYDAAFLGTPKWTLACPPVNEFLHRASIADVPVGVFMTYGGFDEERYLNELVGRLERRGADVPATLRVQRDAIGGDEFIEKVERFREITLERAKRDG